MERGTSYRRLLTYLRPYVWPRFVGGAACMMVYSSTAFYLPFLIRDVFDDIFAVFVLLSPIVPLSGVPAMMSTLTVNVAFSLVHC